MNSLKGTPSKKPAKSDAPLVSYETSGEGKKLPIVIFHCNALSQPQPMAAGQKSINLRLSTKFKKIDNA